MLHGVLTPSSRLLDLYGGIGLFAVGLDHGGPVTVVERDRNAVADARVNLARRAARVVRTAVHRYRTAPADVVVADPSRRGLERAGVECVVRTGAPHLVLVSCDVGALGRDAGLLRGAGFDVRSVVVVDAFPMTSHVEVVTHWWRADRTGTTA
jgi:tRNA/tmRNA/rRNA uracil-C5-methylase (TrmA/RlmC/RlmD family)